MAEITPSGNDGDSSDSCNSASDSKPNPQVVYASNNSQIKTEPAEKDSDAGEVRTSEDMKIYNAPQEKSSELVNSHGTERCINLDHHSHSELVKRGFSLRPAGNERFPSRRDQLSEPKITRAREDITRYNERKSPGFASQRPSETIPHRYDADPHIRKGILAREEGKNFATFGESREDYHRAERVEERRIFDAQQAVHVRRNHVYIHPQPENDDGNQSIHNPKAFQPRVQCKKDDKNDSTFKVSRKSFTPNRIYHNEPDYPKSRIDSPRSSNVPLKRRYEERASPDGPPNVTILNKHPSKYPADERRGKHHEDREYYSHWGGGGEEHERKPPFSSHFDFDSPKNRNGESRGAKAEPVMGTAGCEDSEMKEYYPDHKWMREDFPMKRMGKEAYLGRREHRDLEFVSREELAQEKADGIHREHKWAYPNRAKDFQHVDPAKTGRRYSQGEAPPSNEDLPGFKDPRYRYPECYVVRGCRDYGCDSYGEMTSSVCPSEDGQEGKRARRLSQDEEKRMSDMGYPPSYQRCCCPCCPCYSAYRPAGREQSPVSPRCHPRPPPVSPRHFRGTEFPIAEKPKPKVPTPTQVIPAELQTKLVSRNIPHLRRRRNRTVYTHDQIEELEEVFKIKHYLDVDEKGSIAKRLGIRTENVEIWFKNRRAKWRKEMKSMKCSADSEIGHFIESPDQDNGESKDEYGDAESPVTFAKDLHEERATMTLYHSASPASDSAREVPVDN